MTAPSTLGRAALRYAEAGWFVFPLLPRSKSFPWTGHPAFQAPKGEGGFKMATTNADHLRAAWTAEPQCNIGLWPGPSDLVVIDADGPDGEATLRGVGLLGEPGLSVVTGRADGGRHLYFASPGFPIERDNVGPHTTLRHFKGFVVAPPSIHPETGRAYRWQGAIADLKPLPPKLLEHLCPAPPADMGAAPTPRIRLDAIGPLVEGRRHVGLGKVLGWLARRAHPDDDPALLLWIAEAVNRAYATPPQDPDDVRRMLEDFLGREQAKRSAAVPATPAQWGAPVTGWGRST